MPFFILPLLALFGMGVALAARKSAPASSPPQTVPAAYGPPGAQPAPTPVNSGPTAAELMYFDIRPDGVRIWKEPYRTAILNSLHQWGISFYAPGDATTVQLVPRGAPTDATAAQWALQFGLTRHILAGRWLAVPDDKLPANTPKYLRAVAPGEEPSWAGTGQNAIYAVLAWSQSAQPAPGPAVPPATPNLPPPPPPPVQADAFSGLPPKLADEARRAMRDERDPEKLIQVADAIEGAAPDQDAYVDAAEALRKRAKELRSEIEVKAITQNRTHVLRKKSNGQVEFASELALHYTGNANAWRDLVATNKHVKMRIMKGEGPEGQKYEYLHPWSVGQRVILPPSWDTSKGLPAAA